MMAMIAELISASKTYRLGFRRKPFQALDNISFGICEGALTGFVGPNGSGKSTSIKLLLGLIYPDAGQCLAFGKPAGDRHVFQRIGYVAENVSFSDTLKPLEVLAYHGRVHGLSPAQIKSRSDLLLAEVGLGAHTSKTIRQFSKGMVQRLAVAVSLMHDPEFLLFDEPMSGLDPIGHRFVIDLLARQHRLGKTICFSSHLLHDIDELCDQLVVIYRGALVYQGAKEGFTSRRSKHQIVFERNTPPDWLAGAEPLGTRTWRVTGSAAETMDWLKRLLNDGAVLQSYGRESSTLESSFMELVGDARPGVNS